MGVERKVKIADRRQAYSFIRKNNKTYLAYMATENWQCL